MALPPGTRLGPYEILSAIGAGGMGEVYRARDTRLDRTVAIKVLPAHVASDPDLRQRFEREARAVAALNHPHICTLHDVGQQDGIDYLVMEYLEGQTLTARLEKGALPLEQALQYAIQIADALAKAHRQGIVHRDLKPGNIMLTKSGAKLLDFGLAKTTAPVVAGNLSMLPTTPPNLTAHGTILGTFQYMAPEQLEGQEADARTDIFAFGAVLYEILTGRKAFEGKSQASLIGAILKDEPPPVSSAQHLGPPALDRMVAGCLAKDADNRWQSAADLGKELKWIANDGGLPQASSAAARETRSSRTAWALTTCAALVAVGAVTAAVSGWITGVSADAARVVRLAFPRPAGTALTNLGRPAIAMSPDGTKVVFVADYQLYIRDLSRSEAEPIAGTAIGQVMQPFFSPDGQWIGFVDFEARVLRRIPVTGGAALPIGPAGTDSGYGASWGSDGQILFANSEGIFRVSAEGGTPEPVVTLAPGEFVLRPQLLPDGEHLLFTLATGVGPDRWDDASIVVQSLSTGQRDVILKGGSDARYLATGHLVYALGADVLAVAFDARAGRVNGAPIVIERGVLRPTGGIRGVAQFAVSPSGHLAYLPDALVSNLLTFIEPTTGTLAGRRPFSDGAFPRVSPDGSRLAVLENGAIWVYVLNTTTAPHRVTSAGVGSATWAPDGLHVAFSVRTPPGDELRRQASDGSGASERLGPGTPVGWSRDGRIFVFADEGPGGRKLWVRRSNDEPQSLWNAEWGGSLSPSGEWVAFYTAEGARNVVYVGSVHDPSRRYQVSKEGGHHPLWSPDESRLYYAANSTGPATALMTVDVERGPTIAFGEPSVAVAQIVQPLNQGRQYDVRRDGRVIALVPDPQRSTRSGEVVVVLNWFEELKAKVPAN